MLDFWSVANDIYVPRSPKREVIIITHLELNKKCVI